MFFQSIAPRTEAWTCFASLIGSPDPCGGLETALGLVGLRLLSLQTALFLLPGKRFPGEDGGMGSSLPRDMAVGTPHPSSLPDSGKSQPTYGLASILSRPDAKRRRPRAARWASKFPSGSWEGSSSVWKCWEGVVVGTGSGVGCTGCP